MATLEQLWISHGYPSPIKFYKILKKSSHPKTLQEVDSFVRGQKTSQLHFKPRRTVEGHIVAYCKNCMWFSDLLDMSNYSRQNKGYKWILLCVDTFTRKAYATGLKTKSKTAVRAGVEVIMAGMGESKVKLIVTDSGSEFLNRPVQDLLRDLKIEHHTVEVGDHKALGIIDRLSRTIKEIIFKDFTQTGSVRWHHKLQDYIDAYNSNPHGSLPGDISPNQAASGKHDSRLEALNMSKSEPVQSDFKAGDSVRKKLKKPSFKKGYKQIWSDSIYKIKEINTTGVKAELNNDSTVRLEDLQAVPDAPSLPESQNAVQKADRQHKIEQIIKHKEGLDSANIMPGSRTRSDSKRYNLRSRKT